MSLILDASALLALLHREPGAERVEQSLQDALVSAVNWAEVIQKSLWRRADISGLRKGFIEVGVAFEPFTAEQGEIAARIWERTRGRGLSLADRACLALAMERKLPILTADQAWSELDLELDIRIIR